MLEAALAGAIRALSDIGIVIIILGTLYGMIVGILPGISGAMGLILLIPFTFAWKLDHALLLFASAWGGASYGGAVTAILIGVPGESTNAMTTLDGYPLARQGRAGEALGASAMATALGASVGIFILVALIPLLRSVVLLFGPAEFFGLALLGLAVIALVSGGSLVKGLLSGALGLLLGLVGLNPVTGVSRYDLGTLFLQDGVPILPVFIGMFAFAQSMDLILHHTSVSEEGAPDQPMALGRGLWDGVLSVFRHFGLFLRCSAIGTLIGAIPGPGGSVATFLAYGHAISSARDASKFGKGDIRGVIAPEAANDAKDGGSLIPLVAFGVPGTVSAGIILLALRYHGLRVGPELLGPNLPTVFVLLTSLFLSNWITSIIGLATGRWLVRLTYVPSAIVGPAVIVLCVVGALANRGLFEDVLVMLAFGLLGYLFMRVKMPVVPLVIALLLTNLLETSFHQVIQIGDGTPIILFTRPISVILLLLVAGTVLSPIVRHLAQRRANRQTGSPA